MAAFPGIYNIESITIPPSVKEVESAFTDSSIKEVVKLKH